MAATGSLRNIWLCQQVHNAGRTPALRGTVTSTTASEAGLGPGSRLRILPASRRSFKCAASAATQDCDLPTAAPLKTTAEVANACEESLQRRPFLLSLSTLALTGGLTLGEVASADESGPKLVDMPAIRGKGYGKTVKVYPDYSLTDSGLQYKDLRPGTGPSPKQGQTVVVDWDGFTLGYYGRVFEARNKAKGGSFEGNDKDFFRFKLGKDKVIPAFEEALLTMQVGGVRRIIVPPELGYPGDDWTKGAPRPTTFSGQRALDFVMKNEGLIDKTLLFDIELIRIGE